MGRLRHGLPPPQGLVAIPVSIFFSVPHQKFFDHYIRFCFVKVTEHAWGGKSSPSLPRPPGEMGRTGLCWCRMNPRSGPWTRSCRSGRLSSHPDSRDISPGPCLVPAHSVRLCLCPALSHPRWKVEGTGGARLCNTE